MFLEICSNVSNKFTLKLGFDINRSVLISFLWSKRKFLLLTSDQDCIDDKKIAGHGGLKGMKITVI